MMKIIKILTYSQNQTHCKGCIFTLSNEKNSRHIPAHHLFPYHARNWNKAVLLLRQVEVYQYYINTGY